MSVERILIFLLGVKTHKIFSKLCLNFFFYIELFKDYNCIATRRYFFWKTANFSDSYWFLYNTKFNKYSTLVSK